MDCFGVRSRYLILARYQWYLDSLLGKFTFFPHPRPWLEPIGAPHSTSPAAETGDFAAPGHARGGCQGRRADVFRLLQGHCWGCRRIQGREEAP